MKLLHLSDLHLGIRLCGYSMIDDQKFILNHILTLCDEEHPDAVLIAGDVYDRPFPPIEAISLFGEFLSGLHARGIEVFVIGGNHDSVERLAFASDLIEGAGVHIAPPYNGSLTRYTVKDAYGEVDICLLPFSHLSELRRFFPEQKLATMQDAYAAILAAEPPATDRRTVLVCHPFVAGSMPSDSEDIFVGGLDVVGEDVFSGYDYVALGHIHSPQVLKNPALRYCGTPLAYSFSECGQQKSAVFVTLEEKGKAVVTLKPLSPMRPIKELRGAFSEVCNKDHAEAFGKDAYIRVTLTDEEDIPEALARLRAYYPYICSIRYDNRRTRETAAITMPTATKEKDPVALFSELYRLQNNAEMSEAQSAVLVDMVNEVFGGGV
ncbi:MAG: exonuclease SbcCD subunit D [Clostridia bacterium]|nr:exonuclease SbcCD subunit D [Clostridia bacterium]